MSGDVTRREFVIGAAAAAAAASIWPHRTLAERSPWWTAPGATDPTIAQPFDLARVQLAPGPFLDQAEIARRHLLSVEPDRLLHMFRLTAGLPSSAQPLGGWEAPVNELRGHYTGHFMSGCALMSTSMRDPELRKRGAYVVSVLAQCQQALGNGYVSAFPEEFFDRLREGKNVWAPFYTIHKIMAGLLDTYTYTGNAQAMTVLTGLATWTRGWVSPLGDEEMARVLEREYGGMNEVLYNLSAVTGDAQWAHLAHRFDHERIFAPLALGRDELKGLHVNTTIPKIIGAARRYEVVGDARYHAVADYFWREVTGHRAYCTGGTSNGEGWQAEPDILSTQLSGYTQECCTTYNMLKLTRHVFGWTADPKCADFYERALFNGILGTQHPANGMTLYYVPLASGFWKLFGHPNESFWCCNGTGLESYSKFGDSIYFHDDAGVYVNLFIASELDWQERGVRLVQNTRFPLEESTRLTVHCARPTRLALRVRVPYWVSRGGSASLNGRRLDAFAAPSSYLVLDRTWRDGDRLQVELPMALHTDPTPDDATVQAIMYGPLVLAGRLGTAGLTPDVLRAEPTKPRTVPEYKADPVPAPSFVSPGGDLSAWITKRSGAGAPLEFRTVGQATDVTLVPLNTVIDERYAVYWKVAPHAT
ncbi:MAG TPA: beta-L-arabinofuranosidase domain-containing protein [Gemmatimonadaceae bacterium]|nr:beta-L-arabinofuranosidase domain-containing protein [Gemmatimonadaceae bacterium]